MVALIDLQSGYVLVAITLIALPVAATAFARSGPAWQGLGKGPFAIEQELPPSRLAQPAPPVDRALQEAEARQMLEAKSYRRRQRGEPPIDVEAEVARLLDAPGAAGPGIDEKLREEVRQLVIAGNERRMRRGEQPLDVERETERQLTAL
ncbi:MAG TPA: hypothetical protein VHQ43_05595 [Solirubrobacterales bacterium]|jgi:hypothetical protein|nr:hypothetical protein [Solirubrobacterales bacterium]